MSGDGLRGMDPDAVQFGLVHHILAELSSCRAGSTPVRQGERACPIAATCTG
ncbi:hypothetical protein ACFY8B_35705 [Streptomyces sp. NPDC012751]|uniref:hypothetical protein n=1 Tax=Streptomyces sp. NPDC012751 TaxID=3364846 RepID=UPI0036CAD364